ncbi:hypothetical protein [Streptomyces sp. NPDC049585]|uniref:hypothetical protein n=1 Tax=Streptomyces sp. NPDC049585 TaxID=3155154 RepID=UPI00342D6E27
MAISVPSPRRLLAVCGLALALTLTGCTGDDKAPTGSTASPSASISASPSASPTSRATPTPAPSPTTDPAPTPSPSHARTSRPTADAPTTSAPAAATTCEIRSSAGNCYKAGQFCRKADVGATTHDATGRLLTCGGDGSRPRWH